MEAEQRCWRMGTVYNSSEVSCIQDHARLVTGQGRKGIYPAVELKLPRKTKQENEQQQKTQTPNL